MTRIALAVAAALVFAVPAAAHHGGFDGTRVTAYGPPVTVPSSEGTIVHHGWVTGNFKLEWAALSPEEKREFHSDVWRFELWLSVDGADAVQVPLDSTMHVLATPGDHGPATLQMSKMFFVEFPAGTFAPGTTVVLTGRWYGDTDDDEVSELEVETSRVVTFA